MSHTEMMIRVLSEVARHFPYSGTAASVGSGRILFATVSILITSFIFLPAHILEEDDWDSAQPQGRKRALEDKLREQRRLRRDKRLVVNLAKYSKTWRVFPIPIEQSAVPTTMLQDNMFQLYKDLHTDDNIHERGVVSMGPYTPVFCLELACWLNEASWQAYYSVDGIPSRSSHSTGMNLEGLGLRLEGAVVDDVTDTQAYIATNMASQVDGEEDSVIVISFRGTASASNLQTDLKSKQVSFLPRSALYLLSMNYLTVTLLIRRFLFWTNWLASARRRFASFPTGSKYMMTTTIGFGARQNPGLGSVSNASRRGQAPSRVAHHPILREERNLPH